MWGKGGRRGLVLPIPDGDVVGYGGLQREWHRQRTASIAAKKCIENLDCGHGQFAFISGPVAVLNLECNAKSMERKKQVVERWCWRVRRGAAEASEDWARLLRRKVSTVSAILVPGQRCCWQGMQLTLKGV